MTQQSELEVNEKTIKTIECLLDLIATKAEKMKAEEGNVNTPEEMASLAEVVSATAGLINTLKI